VATIKHKKNLRERVLTMTKFGSVFEAKFTICENPLRKTLVQIPNHLGLELRAKSVLNFQALIYFTQYYQIWTQNFDFKGFFWVLLQST
jgi:hypothetical protein